MKPLSPEVYSRFVLQALALEPYTWRDHSGFGSFGLDKLRLEFRAGDRARSVFIEGPNNTELLLVDRLRELAGDPPAVPERGSSTAAGRDSH